MKNSSNEKVWQSPESAREKTESFWDLHYWIYDFTWAIAQRNSYKRISAESHHWSGLRVLEVGCGKGHLAQKYSDKNEYHLIDYSPVMVKSTQDKCAELALKHIKSVSLQSALDLQFPSGHFDRVICAHVLTVVPDLERAVSEIHRVLKPGGELLVSNSYSFFRGKPAQLLNGITKRLGWYYSRDTQSALTAGGFALEKTLFRGFYEVSLFSKPK